MLFNVYRIGGAPVRQVGNLHISCKNNPWPVHCLNFFNPWRYIRDDDYETDSGDSARFHLHFCTYPIKTKLISQQQTLQTRSQTLSEIQHKDNFNTLLYNISKSYSHDIICHFNFAHFLWRWIRSSNSFERFFFFSPYLWRWRDEKSATTTGLETLNLLFRPLYLRT